MPSRNIISISIICIATLISVGVYESRPLSNNDVGNESIVALSETGINLEVTATEDTTDTDRDGLKDWQEVIWETDPLVSDTDGDGTEDGDEVDTDRNPNQAGPNDKLVRESDNTPLVYSRVENNSVTDKLSKNLFSIFMQAKSGGGEVSAEDAKKIAGSAAGIIGEDELNQKKYSIEAITTFPQNDSVLAKSYSQNLANLYIDMLYEVKKTNGNLGDISIAYRKAAREMSLLPVPDSLANTHLNLINNFNQSGVAFNVINSSESDPVRAALALKIYQNLSQELPTLFTTIATYVRRNGILFDDPQVTALWENI